MNNHTCKHQGEGMLDLRCATCKAKYDEQLEEEAWREVTPASLGPAALVVGTLIACAAAVLWVLFS